MKWSRAKALLAILVAATVAPSLASTFEVSLYGRRIASVVYAPPEQPYAMADLQAITKIRVGDTLNERELGQAIERLYATGRYDDILVEAEPEGDGVALKLRLAPRYFIGRLTVGGVAAPPSREQLLSVSALALGEALDDDTLSNAERQMQTLLRANGYYDASVSHDVTKRTPGEQAEVLFTVTTGRRARFTPPDFAGELHFKATRLIRATAWRSLFGIRSFGWREWREATDSRLQRGMERMRGVYAKQGFLMATVRLSGLDYDASTNTVKPRVEIHSGAKVDVKTEGARMSQGELRRILPIYQEHSVDNELLAEGVRRLQDYFVGEGYFDAQVRYTQSSADGVETVVYRIARGQRSRFTRVTMRGNQYFDRATLEERLSIQPAALLHSRRGKFSTALLEHDVQAIEELYRSNGFRDVKVRAEVMRGEAGKPQQVGVAFHIDEGKQVIVEALELKGAGEAERKEVDQLLISREGQPFSVSNVALDRDAILNYYFNSGYPEASFDTQIEAGETPTRVRVKYQVTPGKRVFTRGVLLSGLETTRRSLVERRMAIEAGAPLSQGAIVETQRRLYDLGIFNTVDVGVQNADGSERDKYVVMQVDEAKRYTLNLGFGAEVGRIGGSMTSFDAPAGSAGFSPRALIGVTRANMFGIGHTAALTTRVSTIQQRAMATYLAPQFQGNDALSLSFSALFDRSADIRTFTSRRVEGAVQLSQKLSRSSLLQYRLALRQVALDVSSLKISPDLIPIYSVPVRTMIASATWIQDRRDDPLESTRGVYNSVDFGIAPPSFTAGTYYTRLVVRNSSYHQVTRDLVIARTASFGWLSNLSDKLVPLPERFFGGGNTTNRGFPENQAGPRDPITGFPLGGDAFLFVGTELRFPLMGRTLGGVLFHDMGNVFSEADKISFRVKQRNNQDFDYMVHSVGLGFRYRTPIGPVRIDIGYSPNSPRFTGYRGTREDLLNGALQLTVPQRVNPIQFFFSLGQTF